MDNGKSFDREMRKIRELDFAIQETAMYLDAYPDSKAALDYYTVMRKMREAAVEEYEKKHGPLTIFGNMSNKSWQWTEKPWPWEPEAN